MKKIYFSLFVLCIAFNSKAQLTLTKTNNEPVIGHVVNSAEYDSTTAIPKATGSGLSWNFSSLTAATFTEVTTYTTVASTPNASMFTAANIVVSRGTGTNTSYDYYNNQTASIGFVGMAEPGNNSTTVFSNQGVWLNYPTAFGNNNSDAFTATEIAPTTTNNWNGTISYTATGSGTVTLPGGFIHTNCLQLKKNINLVVSGTDTGTMTMTQYEYYSSSQRYPILNIEYQSMTSGTNTSSSASIYVNTAALISGLSEQTINGNVIVYPNPAKDLVHIQLFGNVLAEKIELFDVAGKLLVSSKNTNSLNTSSIAKGIYLIKVSSGNSVMQKQIIISE